MRINEVLRKENLGKVYQIIGYIKKGEYIVAEYNGHVYLQSRENFKKIEENFYLDTILGMSFEESLKWEEVSVDTKVLVSNDGEDWYNRHFAKYDKENKNIYTWVDGKTSFTTELKEKWLYFDTID